MTKLTPAKAFVVIAEFQVKPDCLEAFLEAAKHDAQTSLSDEPGCRQFDIIQPQAADGTIIFYEVYDSRAAFDAHLETAHVDDFRRAFPPLVVSEKPVRFAGRLYH